MPTSSGLYEDSDDESMMNELSPTDGYFNPRSSHPQDLLVPDPSPNTADSDKVREARAETRVAQREVEATAALRRGSEHTAHPTSSRRSLDPTFEDESYTEHSQLISSAPPAYSAATAGRTYRPSVPDNRTNSEVRGSGYNTMGRQEIFLPIGHPEDLGGQSYGSTGGSDEDGWAKRARRFVKAKYVVILIALLIGIGFITAAILSMVDYHRTVASPISGKPGHDELSGDAPRSCPSGLHFSSTSFTFPRPSTFEFTQLVRNIHDSRHADGSTYGQVRLSGEIHVRPTLESLQDNVRVDFGTHFSESGMMKSTGWERRTDSLRFYTPSHVYTDSSSSSRPCMFSKVTIWIAPGAKLDALVIKTESFSVTVHEGLSLDTKFLNVLAVAGSVSFPSKQPTASTYNNRKVVVSTISGSISGAFPLYDLLSIASVSGTINIDLDIKEAAERAPVPAQLHVETVSGSVYINTPTIVGAGGVSTNGAIPDRDYRVFISSTSGTQYVNVIHGSETILHSVSGTIHATLSPYGSPSAKSNIDVVTKSASVEVTVLSSISHPGQTMKNMYGSYKRLSGSLKVKYPGEWEGEVEGSTLSGSLHIAWPGLTIIRDGRTGGSGYRVLKAIKGHGDGRLYFEGVSGSTDLIGGALRREDLGTPPSGGPTDEPLIEIPDLGGAPPPRWPGYDDEWILED